MIYKLEHPEVAESLFVNEQDTMILSCLQNVMGAVYADDPIHPDSAMAVLGVFCFFAGKANRELVQFKPEAYPIPFIIMSASDASWKALIKECYGNKVKEVVRYAIKKEKDVFSKEWLQRLVDGLSKTYEIKLIDKELFDWSRKQDWCREWTSLYADYAEYQEKGLGVAVLKDHLPVSGASSYSSYRGGIEIQVDTKKEYRGCGLASAASAKLILECLRRGWYPSWDAHNIKSVGLAEKLGYHYAGEYSVFEIHGY